MINWHFEKKKLSDLKIFEDNPRIINSKTRKKLDESLDSIGMAQPINIDIDNTIISGHARYYSLKEKGIDEVDCYLPERKLTDQEKKEVVVRMNATFGGEWDWEKLSDEEKWDKEDLLDWGVEDNFIETEENEELELSGNQEDMLNKQWGEWCSEILTTINKLEGNKIFAQSYNKARLRIEFLNALFLKKKISRSATTGYQYHRMLCSGDGKSGSIFDLLGLVVDNKEKAPRLRFALQEKPSLEKLMTVSGVPMAGHKAPLDFPPELALSLYTEFGNKGKILDPCHGWGGRYMGFLLSECEEYTGIDASPLTSDALKEMHNDLRDLREKKAEFICKPYEDTDLIKSNYDFALTSPPYFDRETYIGGEQAHTRYKNYNEFINGFYKELISKTFDYLKDGCVFALQVGNQKYDLIGKAQEIGKEVGFIVKAIRTTEMVGMSTGKKKESSEKIVILKKPNALLQNKEIT